MWKLKLSKIIYWKQFLYNEWMIHLYFKKKNKVENSPWPRPQNLRSKITNYNILCVVLGVRTRVELDEDAGESPLPESRPISMTKNFELSVKNNEI